MKQSSSIIRVYIALLVSHTIACSSQQESSIKAFVGVYAVYQGQLLLEQKKDTWHLPYAVIPHRTPSHSIAQQLIVERTGHALQGLINAGHAETIDDMHHKIMILYDGTINQTAQLPAYMQYFYKDALPENLAAYISRDYINTRLR